jgi:hypothetical protein
LVSFRTLTLPGGWRNGTLFASDDSPVNYENALPGQSVSRM